MAGLLRRCYTHTSSGLRAGLINVYEEGVLTLEIYIQVLFMSHKKKGVGTHYFLGCMGGWGGGASDHGVVAYRALYMENSNPPFSQLQGSSHIPTATTFLPSADCFTASKLTRQLTVPVPSVHARLTAQ